jgi:hypothetical protein
VPPVDILPDSRPRELRGAVKRNGVEMRPVYCASCGNPQGLVPVGMTYAFFLCDRNGCAEKYGHDAHFMKEPDHVFWDKARELKEAEEKRLLAEQGPTAVVNDAFLARQLENPTSFWSKLKADFDRHLRRFAAR